MVFDKAELVGGVRNRQHNLFGQRFAGHRTPGWHELGTVFQDALGAEEATKLGRLDYEIQKIPLFVNAYGQEMETGTSALVRQPTDDAPEPFMLGTVSNDYRLLQNMEIARILEPMTGEWPVETVGALGNGERAFWCLDAGEAEVAGENLRQYFVVVDVKNGGNALRIINTPIRTECQNTLATGMAAATLNIALPHRVNLEKELDWYVQLQIQMRKQQQTLLEQFRAMATQKVVAKQVNAILKAAYPDVPAPRKVRMADALGPTTEYLVGTFKDDIESARRRQAGGQERQEQFRASARELFERFNDEFPAVGGTAWAIYNAVVELEDWRDGPGDRSEIATSVLFGDRAKKKEKAFGAALATVK